MQQSPQILELNMLLSFTQFSSPAQKHSLNWAMWQREIKRHANCMTIKSGRHCAVHYSYAPYVSASTTGDILPPKVGRKERTERKGVKWANNGAKRVVSEFISNNYAAINKQMTAIKLQPGKRKGGAMGEDVELCQVQQSTGGSSEFRLVSLLHYSGNISHTHASRNALYACHTLPFVASWIIFQ